MWITAKKLYITKCVLWILGAVIIPIFIWWRPSHIYETDKSSIVIEDTYRGRKFEFDATNTFGHTIHAQYLPQGAYYKLIVDGREMCDLHYEYTSQDSFIYDDTHIFYGCTVLSTLGSIVCVLLQLFIIIFCIIWWVECGDIEEGQWRNWRGYVCEHELGFSIKNVWHTSKNDFWFSKVFRLYITEEELIKINKFFGFNNPYLDDSHQNNKPYLNNNNVFEYKIFERQ